MLPLMRPYFSRESTASVERVLASGWWAYGPCCKTLETCFTRRGGWSMATNSCTAALYLAALACRREGENEVIIPAVSFVSTGMAFAAAGYRVVVCDVQQEDLLLSAACVRKHVGPATRAIVPVHLYGQHAKLDEIRMICDEHGIPMIEDCAHRIDLNDSSPPLGDFACYSFNAVKELPCGEGGLLWSRDETSRERIEQWSYLGLPMDTFTRSNTPLHRKVDYIDSWGLKLRLTDLMAALVLDSLPNLGTFREQRARIFDAYMRVLEPYAGYIRLLPRTASDSFLMIVCRVVQNKREHLRACMARHQVATSIHYDPLHKHPRFCSTPCPIADRAAGELLTLPAYIGLALEDIAGLSTIFDEAFTSESSEHE